MIEKGIKCKLPIHHFGNFRGYYKRLLNDKRINAQLGVKEPQVYYPAPK